ncbi:MAG TPA: UDP-glucose/GDP-mannose dehydrogenase family protein [Gammaproteobacteria bacterium]|nr:UDP-glucose/GDP-mannose dehydrogenase family protein [Gammaproteobacteria bacterium]
MRVTIFGSGYVGLVTGACLAEAGNHVLCIDIDADKIERLARGEVPIFEPGLERLIESSIEAGRLSFSTDVAAGVAHGLFQFVCVGTPPEEDGSADLAHVLTVARSIGEHLDDYRIVVNKSTVPVGTGDAVKAEIAKALRARQADVEFDVVSNPEFLKEGAAVGDFMKPDRIVIGTDNPRTAELLRTLYEPFNRSHDRTIVMDVRSAELTKYAANALLATKISFMNEIANLAELTGADIEQVRVGIGSDPRIGYEFIYPGCGYGGSCFPKDIKALVAAARVVGYPEQLLSAVEGVNQRQKQSLFRKIEAHFDGRLDDKTVAVWGLAFKPNTDDMREASSRVLIEALWAAGTRVRAYDPVAADVAREIYGDRPDLEICTSAESAVEGADVLAIVTEWREFRSPDFDTLRRKLASPVIFDGRNLYDPKLMRQLGFKYFAIGRGDSVTIGSQASLSRAAREAG